MPGPPSRLVLAALALFLLFHAGSPYAAPPGAAEVRIGVRVDARPFIWKDGVTGNYLGFLWDICTEGVQRAGYTFSETEVDAEARADFLREGTLGGGRTLDLFCDPTTITLKRVENFATGRATDLEFSPIIFVANATHMTNAGARLLSGAEVDRPPDCAELIRRADDPATGAKAAVPQSAPAAKGTWLERLQRRFDFTLRQPAQEELPAQRRYEIWGYVGGTTIGEALNEGRVRAAPASPTVTCLRPMPSHGQAAAAFCEGRLDRYYGDVDIMRAAIADYRSVAGDKCPVDAPVAADVTYEPYALVVSSRLPEFPERFALALYGMFSDGTVERLFAGHFAEAPRSDYLSTLFRLNRIPAGADDPASAVAGGMAALVPESGRSEP